MHFWWTKKNPEKDLSALVEDLRSSLGDQLKSVVVFGSIASNEFDPKHSNVNVLVISDLSPESLGKIGPAMKTWLKRGHIPPVMVAPHELEEFARDFPIEFLDMQEKHRVLHGENPLKSLTVNKKHLEAQCEHDLAVVQLRLRQAVAASAEDEKKLRQALIQSSSSVRALFRAVERLGEKAPKLDRIEGPMHDLAVRYLSTIEKVLQDLRKR